MHEQVEKLLAGTNNETFTTVARGALGESLAELAGSPTFSEITSSHNDQRTIGIVKVSGQAMVGDQQHRWSSVVKFINPNVDEPGYGILDIERKIYEQGLFSDPNIPFRAARFYKSNEDENGILSLWLEDLTSAPQPPWDLDQFSKSANHIGQFNGHNAQNNVHLPFETPRDQSATFWNVGRNPARSEELLEARDAPLVRQGYGDTPIEATVEFAELFTRVLQAGIEVPHTLSFGDCHSRNMFPVGEETVGIDWAAAAMEPNGSDAGRLIGSPLSYGVEEANMAGQNERAIFDSYVNGLKTAGWNGDVDEIRLGFFCQFGGYLTALGYVPINLETYRPRQEWIEKRFGVPFDELVPHIAPIIALIPGYTEELRQLLD
jgi:hypothetical protein